MTGDGRPDQAPPCSRWTSFVADPGDARPRILHEEGNPPHRARVEHNRDTILVHLSGEEGWGWTVLAEPGPRRVIASNPLVCSCSDPR